MTYSNYRTFITIVETLSLAETARRLHLSPSAVSKQLSVLEQRLGTKLVHRSTRSLQITEAGELFYRRCIDIVSEIDNAESQIRELSGDLSGVLYITMPQALSTPEFAGMLEEFTRLHADISLDIEVSNDPKNLIEKRLDVGFRVGVLKDSRLIAIELFEADIVMCASQEYLEHKPFPKTIEELKLHKLLVPNQYYLPSEPNKKSPVTPSVDLNDHILCNDVALLVSLAKKGAGLALLWDSYVQEELKEGTLVKTASPFGHERRPVSLIYTSRDYMPQGLTLFIQHVKHHFLGGSA